MFPLCRLSPQISTCCPCNKVYSGVSVSPGPWILNICAFIASSRFQGLPTYPPGALGRTHSSAWDSVSSLRYCRLGLCCLKLGVQTETGGYHAPSCILSSVTWAELPSDMKGESTRALERSEQKPRCQTVGMVASLAPIPPRETWDLQASEVLQPPDVFYSIHFKSRFSNYIIKDTHVLSV